MFRRRTRQRNVAKKFKRSEQAKHPLRKSSVRPRLLTSKDRSGASRRLYKPIRESAHTALSLCIRSDHESRRVGEYDKRNAVLGAEAEETRRFLRGWDVERAAQVGVARSDDSYRSSLYCGSKTKKQHLDQIGIKPLAIVWNKLTSIRARAVKIACPKPARNSKTDPSSAMAFKIGRTSYARFRSSGTRCLSLRGLVVYRHAPVPTLPWKYEMYCFAATVALASSATSMSLQ